MILSRKILGFLFTIVSHAVVVLLLLRDRIVLPIEPIGRPIVAKIISETSEPVRVELAPLSFQAPSVIVEPPQMDLQPGKPVPPQPMVIVDARFAPEVPLIVPASAYPPDLEVPSSDYRAEVSVLIQESGVVGDVYVQRSDGNSRLDTFIVTHARTHWRFLPALHDGVPVLSWKTISVEMSARQMVIRS